MMCVVFFLFVFILYTLCCQLLSVFLYLIAPAVFFKIYFQNILVYIYKTKNKQINDAYINIIYIDNAYYIKKVLPSIKHV